MIKKTNFIMSPCKMINLFQDVVTHVGSGLPQGHKKKVSRPSAIFMINRTQYIYIYSKKSEKVSFFLFLVKF